MKTVLLQIFPPIYLCQSKRKLCAGAENGEVLSWGFPSGNRLGNLLDGGSAQVNSRPALRTSCVEFDQLYMMLQTPASSLVVVPVPACNSL